MSKRKILLAPMEVAGMMLKLHHAFKENGIESKLLTFWEYPFAGKSESEYKQKELNGYFRIVKLCRKYRKKNCQIRVRLLQIIEMLIVLKIFIQNLFHYNSFIFTFGKGIFSNTYYLKKIEKIEYIIYRLFRKRVIMIYVGSDSRPPYCGVFEGDVKLLYAQTKMKASRVKMHEKYTTIIDNPASSQFHTIPFISFNAVLPIMESNEIVRKQAPKSDKVIIVHTPSKKRWKGTQDIRELIEKLKEKGYPIEYVEVSGVSHDKVLDTIKKADILIDQVYSDVPMATLATEGSINQVPVLVGGYYAQFYKELNPEWIAPICYCLPDELETRLTELVCNKEKREFIGREAQDFVIQHHLSSQVYKNFIDILDGNIPKEWLYDPKQSEYIWGSGNTKKEVIEKVAALIDTYGYEALCIDKNKIVFKRYVQEYHDYKEIHTNTEWSFVYFG